MSRSPDDVGHRLHGDDSQLDTVSCRCSRYNEQANREQDDVREVNVLKLSINH